MASLFADDDTRKAFQGVVREIEMRSGAEVLVAVREQSGSAPMAAMRAGVLAAIVVLCVLAFAPWPFRTAWFVIDPVVFGGLGAFLASRIPALERLFTTRRERKRAVEQATALTFFQKGLHLTAARTGLLVYLAVRERLAVVLTDQGIAAAVDPEDWRRAVAAIGESLARGDSGRQIASRVGALGALLAAVAPRSRDTENADGVVPV